VRGLNRVHQFDKVEIVQLVHPDKSYDILEEMVSARREVITIPGIALPYFETVRRRYGLYFRAYLRFEVYSAAQDKWLEVSSVSNLKHIRLIA